MNLRVRGVVGACRLELKRLHIGSGLECLVSTDIKVGNKSSEAHRMTRSHDC